MASRQALDDIIKEYQMAEGEEYIHSAENSIVCSHKSKEDDWLCGTVVIRWFSPLLPYTTTMEDGKPHCFVALWIRVTIWR